MDATVKADVLELIEHALDHGRSMRAACGLLGVDDQRVGRWARRRGEGRLDDSAPGGHRLHGLLAWQREAVLAVYAEWGERDRSRRKLAHRGSYLGRVWVGESTVGKVLAEEDLGLQGNPPREPVPRTPWPDWLECKPNRVWGYDFIHFTRAKRATVAILDIVTDKWIATVVSAEETSTQVEVAVTDVLEAEQLWVAADARAGVAIAAVFGRPGVPQNQAWIETLFGHIEVFSVR